jgi:hypothetical protein
MIYYTNMNRNSSICNKTKDLIMTKNKIVRTETRAEGGITPEEKTRMDEHTKLWISRVMRTDPIEPDKIIPAIERLYEVSGLKKPRVVIVPSPLVMAFAYGASSAILNTRKNTKIDNTTRAATDATTYAATRDATRDATLAATRAATCAATLAATRTAAWNASWNATCAATCAATRDETRDATLAATWNATNDATCAATRDATLAATDDATRDLEKDATKACFSLAGEKGLKDAKNWYDVYQGGNMWGSIDCYLTAARDILGLKLPQHAEYEAWEQAAIHGGFRVMHEEFCLVCDFPEILKVDAENRPHSENGPSHRWRDGWSLYHWHGIRIPAEWIEDRASLTPHMALTWENVEQRRAACEILGWVNILKALDAKIIDTDNDPEIGELVEVDIPEIGREKFLRVLCGTGRQFALPVPPEMTTALEAQAWTWGMDGDSFVKPEIRT